MPFTSSLALLVEAEEYQPAPRASVRDKKKQSYSEDDDEYEP